MNGRATRYPRQLSLPVTYEEAGSLYVSFSFGYIIMAQLKQQRMGRLVSAVISQKDTY